MRICFASHNQNKISEINRLVPEGVEVYGLNDLKISEDIPETGNSFEENSALKATFIFERFNVPVFADDSGLCVRSLNGDPGVYSARYAGEEKDDKKNIQLLIKNLTDKQDRIAEFKTVITYIDSLGARHQFVGSISGEIILEEKGENGFGYDPIFIPNGYKKTFAELGSDVKNQISHRAIAVRKLIAYLSSFS
jgi:XTP/dITP diphosphohydrolase